MDFADPIGAFGEVELSAAARAVRAHKINPLSASIRIFDWSRAMGHELIRRLDCLDH
jgi:hypothetical protein